jgi:hypothetical protein
MSVSEKWEADCALTLLTGADIGQEANWALIFWTC